MSAPAFTLPPSKSVLNRLLILSSLADDGGPIDLSRPLYPAEADDVRLLREALAALRTGARELDAGEGGTTLRFLALRLAREAGSFRVLGSARLFERPQHDLVALLESLGARARLTRDSLEIESNGRWALDAPLVIGRETSSQFASALALAAFALDRPLRANLRGARGSEPYFQLTLALCRRAGLKLALSGNDLTIDPSPNPALDRSLVESARSEADASSVFAVAALAAVSSAGATVTNFTRLPPDIAQPDAEGVKILARMGVEIVVRDGALIVRGGAALRGIEADLAPTPDLFPVVASLAALAKGPSRFTGLASLAHKESDRLAQTLRLVRMTGVEARAEADSSCVIDPAARRPLGEIPPFDFDPDRDHRMAMAAAVLMKAGLRARVIDPSVVTKSFPGFWSVSEAL